MLSWRTEESREFPCWSSVCRELSQASAMQYSSDVDTGGNFPKHVKLQHRFQLKWEGFVHAGARDTSGNCVSAMADTSRAVLSLWGDCKKSGPCSWKEWQGRGAKTARCQDNDATQSLSSLLCQNFTCFPNSLLPFTTAVISFGNVLFKDFHKKSVSCASNFSV